MGECYKKVIVDRRTNLNRGGARLRKRANSDKDNMVILPVPAKAKAGGVSD